MGAGAALRVPRASGSGETPPGRTVPGENASAIAGESAAAASGAGSAGAARATSGPRHPEGVCGVSPPVGELGRGLPAGRVRLLTPRVARPFRLPGRVGLPAGEHGTVPAAAFESPAGYASEIVTPVSVAGFAAGLETEMVRVAVPPAGIEVGANAFVTTGAANALSVAVAAAPVPALAGVLRPVGVTYAPAA